MRKAQYNVDHDWIFKLLDEKNVSLRALARKMNMDPSSLSMTFKGTRALRAEEAMLICFYLKIHITTIYNKFGFADLKDEEPF